MVRRIQPDVNHAKYTESYYDDDILTRQESQNFANEVLTTERCLFNEEEEGGTVIVQREPFFPKELL